MKISADYKWTTYGLDEDSDEYEKALSEVHLRSARSILEGCLKVKYFDSFSFFLFFIIFLVIKMFVHFYKIRVNLTISQ